ncbi:MAG: LamG domain-containing protein [Bacteroidota bacterium]
MKFRMHCIKGLMALGGYLMINLPYGVAQDPVAYFSFDDIRVTREAAELVRGETYVPQEVFAYVKESVSESEFELKGKYYESVAGVKGNGALLDGYTAYVDIMADIDEETEELIGAIPEVKKAFTIESWIALGAYPKNLLPIWGHRKDESVGASEGYSLEIDAWGRPVVKVATLDGKTESLLVDTRVMLNKWAHIACSYSPEKGLSVYVNGEKKGNRKFIGQFAPVKSPEEVNILVGKSRVAVRPTGTIRPEGTETAFTYLDGIIDELKVYDVVLEDAAISKSYKKNKPSAKPNLPVRQLPAGPQSPGIFRAVNTTLKYYKGWDAPWAVDKHEDIVVQFDESDCKFVFWRGTSYIPSWVSENGVFFNNGFNEGWNDHGSCEPMSDKKTKYSRVKIVESNEARVVIQWRYALVDVVGNFAFEDPETGWGDWTNETYYIYPDMTAVREDKLLSNAPHAEHEWQESMVVLGPGQTPEDVLEKAGLTVANSKGEKRTFSWENGVPPQWPEEPVKINSQIINTKSEYKPFSAVRLQDITAMDIYAGEIRRDVSVYPWWNHWPVAPRPTDGRYSNFSDRAAHASLSHWYWNEYKSDDRSMTKIMLCGMTKGSIEDVVKLNQGWANPAEIAVTSGATDASYKAEEKAYHLSSDGGSSVSFTVKGKNDSPIVNPAFVVKGWGNNEAKITVNGKELPKSKDVRYDVRHTLESIDLVVWLRHESTSDLSVSIAQN